MKPRLGFLILFIFSLFQYGCYENLTLALPAKGKVNTFPRESYHSSESFSFLSLSPQKKGMTSAFPAPRQSEIVVNLKGEIRNLSEKSVQYLDDLFLAQPTYLISKANLSKPSSSCFDFSDRFTSDEGNDVGPLVFKFFPDDKQKELMSSYDKLKALTQKEQLRASTLENSPDMKQFFASFIHSNAQEDFFSQFSKRLDRDQLLEVCKSESETYFIFLRSEADAPDRLIVTYWNEQTLKLEEFMGFGPISNAFFKLIPHVAHDRALVFVASGKNQNFGWQFYLLYPKSLEVKRLEACNGNFISGSGDGTNFFEFECTPEYFLEEPL